MISTRHQFTIAINQRLPIHSLLLGFLVWGFADVSSIQAQTQPVVVPPPSNSPQPASPSTGQLSCPSPYAISVPQSSGSIVLPPPPARLILPLRRPSFYSSNPASEEAYNQTKRFAPIAAAYAKANLPQQEAALIAQMQQLVQPAASQGEALLWATLFDAYTEVGADSQAIAAFNQLELANDILPSFIDAFARSRPNPAIAKRLPVLEALVNQHLQTDALAKRQALITLMMLYERAGLQSNSQAIARQLLTAEPNLLDVGTESAALSLIAESSNIALIAGETEQVNRILQKLLPIASSPQFRSTSESGRERDRVLGEKAKFLIEVARQLTQVGQSRQAVPLLNQATQWLQEKRDLPFYHNSQARTLIATYAAAKQITTVVQLLRSLEPSAGFQAEVQAEVVKQALATGDKNMAIQIVQSLPPRSKEALKTHYSVIEQLAQSGEFATAQTLATALPMPDRAQALAMIAAHAIAAGNSELASEIIQQPLTGDDKRLPSRSHLAKRWMDVAAQLTQLQQTTQAQTVLSTAAQLLELEQQQPPQLNAPGTPTLWELRLMLADRYAEAGQRDRAIALLDEVRQQVQTVPTLLSPASPLPLPSFPPFIPSSVTREGVPALAWQVLYPRLRPRPPQVLPNRLVAPPPLPALPPVPKAVPVPKVKSVEPKPSVLSPQIPPPLPLQPLTTLLPEGYDAINRAILSRHYLKAGNVPEAIALFTSIPDKYCAFKPEQADQLLELAITLGQPDAALTFFTASEQAEKRSDWELESRLETLIQIANLYSQQGKPEATAQVLQQAEAMVRSI